MTKTGVSPFLVRVQAVGAYDDDNNDDYDDVKDDDDDDDDDDDTKWFV